MLIFIYNKKSMVILYIIIFTTMTSYLTSTQTSDQTPYGVVLNVHGAMTETAASFSTLMTILTNQDDSIDGTTRAEITKFLKDLVTTSESFQAILSDKTSPLVPKCIADPVFPSRGPSALTTSRHTPKAWGGTRVRLAKNRSKSEDTSKSNAAIAENDANRIIAKQRRREEKRRRAEKKVTRK
jgi:hypothetical protein